VPVLNAPLRTRARGHGGEVLTIVKAPLELGGRSHQILLLYRLVGGNDCGLNVREHRAKPVERGMASAVADGAASRRGGGQARLGRSPAWSATC